MSRKPGRHPIGLAVLGGFVLGAATVLLVVWAVERRGQEAASAPVPSVPPIQTPPPVTVPVPLPRPAPPVQVPMPSPRPAPPTASTPTGTGPSPTAPPPVESSDLARRRLLLPVQGVRPETLQDTFTDARGGGSRTHEALDIPAPRNTPVLAVEDGKVAKLFTSKQGGLTVYQFDPASTYAYYYAHLERYAPDLKEGDPVRRGQVLGYVGTSGDAPPDFPHLHFAIFLLTPEKHWWQGTPVNPYPILRAGP